MVQKKRPYDVGSVYQRNDGRWVAQLRFNGRPKYVYRRSQKEAAAELKRLLKTRENNERPPDDRLTMAAYLDEWLRETVGRTNRRNTATGYEVNVRRHIVPIIGRVPIGRLRPTDVRDVLRHAEDAGLSPRSVQYIHATLRAALSEAERMELVPRNVAKLVRAPTVPERDKHDVTESEARQIMEAVAGDPLEALWLCAFMGLRRGELIALRWSDVDLEAGYLRVLHQVGRVAEAWTFTELKTRKSRRWVALAPFAVDALRRHRVHQAEARLLAGKRWQDLDLVFPSTVGTPLDGSAVSKRFKALLRRVKLGYLHLHDLRHAASTMLRARGHDLKLIQAMLGHATLAMTADLYGGVYPHELRQLSDTMQTILQPDGASEAI